jgi:hypothetical protein
MLARRLRAACAIACLAFGVVAQDLAAQDLDPESVARAEAEAEAEAAENAVEEPAVPAGGGVDPGLHGDDEGEVAIVEVPPPPISREEAEEEEERRAQEEEEQLPPPPDPEWRLRAGAGVGLPLNGASAPYLRLYQEIEWQPAVVAPLVFGLGGAEYVLGGLLGSAGARVGLVTYFCADSTVRCQAAINLVLGAFFGQGVLAFDFGGEGDVRFLFGALELTVRLGFGGGGGINMLHGGAGIGAAF